jgi:hypothetical protein
LPSTTPKPPSNSTSPPAKLMTSQPDQSDETGKSHNNGTPDEHPGKTTDPNKSDPQFQANRKLHRHTFGLM